MDSTPDMATLGMAEIANSFASVAPNPAETRTPQRVGYDCVTGVMRASDATPRGRWLEVFPKLPESFF